MSYAKEVRALWKLLESKAGRVVGSNKYPGGRKVQVVHRDKKIWKKSVSNSSSWKIVWFFIGISNLWTNVKLCVYMPSVMSNKSFCKLSQMVNLPTSAGFSGSVGTHFFVTLLLLLKGVFSPCFPLVQMCTERIKSLVLPDSTVLFKELSTSFLITQYFFSLFFFPSLIHLKAKWKCLLCSRW